MNSLLIASLASGMLTVLAPCIFAALPIMLSRGVDGFARARRVIIGLLGSIFVFTLLLKASTLLIGIPIGVWQSISGGIVALVGVSMLLPDLYAKLALKSGLESIATRWQLKAIESSDGWFGDYALGASLGPIFSACSPTYALIVAVVLPLSPAEGLWYLLMFLLGLGLMMGLIAYGGSALAKKLRWSLNPAGWLKRAIGSLLLFIGLAIITGLDRQLLGWLVENGWYDWQIRLEDSLR